MDPSTAATPAGSSAGVSGEPSRPRFRVEQVVVAGGQAFVLAVRLDPGEDFRIGGATTLGGFRVVECLDLPAELRGMPSRHESRAIFCLADPADGDRLAPGAEVALDGTEPEARAAGG